MKYLDIYLNQLGKPLKVKLWLFSMIGLYMGAKALWKVDQIDLPFHYILFVVPGVLISIWMKKIEKTELIRVNRKVAQRLNFFAIALIVLWLILVEVWLPGIMAYVVEFPNEALQLITAALLLGRISITWRRIEQFILSENKRYSLHLATG